MFLSEIPKMCSSQKGIQSAKELMYLRFRDHHLFQSSVPFIFRDDGFRGRLRKDAEEGTDVKEFAYTNHDRGWTRTGTNLRQTARLT